MFKSKKKLSMIRIEFFHGEESITPLEVKIEDGQQVKEEFGTIYIRDKEGYLIKSIDPKAGYTTIVERFYQ